jgi:cell wall-associated NlpC family hydrolase
MEKFRCVTERYSKRLLIMVALSAISILATACQSTSQGFLPFSSIFKPSAPSAAADPDPEPRTFDSAEIGELQDRLLEEVSVRKPDMIDLSICVNGLQGRLATGQVGQSMLGGYNQGPGPSVDESIISSATNPSLAPSSNKNLRSKAHMTKEILVSAYSQSGQPFKVGGRSPQTGFDGPGLVSWVYTQNGIKVPQSAQDLVAKGVAVKRENLRPGDIVAYQTPKSTGYLVGIYTGNGNFIHASQKFNVVSETAAFGTDFGPYFLGGRRYVDDPEAAPLNDDLKTAVANGAVKTALMNLGDNVPKPANIYGGASKNQAKAKSKKSKTIKKTSSKKKASRSNRK